MRLALVEMVSKAISSFGIDSALITLDIPENPAFGDFSCNIAMKTAKSLGKNPRAFAQEIIDSLPADTIIEKTEIAGPGFINFFIKPNAVAQSFLAFCPENPIRNENPKKICVEFSSPNVAKPLHFGHLRTTIIGDSIARILSYLGHTVIRENFWGDWGTGFGKLVVALEKWGDMKKIEQSPIEELVLLYKKFIEEAEKNPALDDEAREAFRKMEMEDDETILREWKWIRAVSIEQVQKFYDYLHIPPFDWSLGESFYASFNTPTLEKIETIGEISEGALVVRFVKEDGEDRMPLILFRRADGATLYQTRDVSHLLYCESQGIDEFITVVANEQSLHFAQIFDTVKRLGCTMQCEHVSFGLVLGADGKKFSTRRGNGVGLEEVFDEAKEKIEGIISDRVSDFSEQEKAELIEQIAIGAIKFNDLSQNRNTDIVFHWDKILSFEGFSGPFLQYSYARAKSILQKSDHPIVFPASYIPEGDELLLIKKILEFPEMVSLAGSSRRPNVLAEYLFQMAKQFNAFYQNNSILKAETDEIIRSRLYMVEKFSKTLKTGLSLLGIAAPEKM